MVPKINQLRVWWFGAMKMDGVNGRPGIFRIPRTPWELFIWVAAILGYILEGQALAFEFSVPLKYEVVQFESSRWRRTLVFNSRLGWKLEI
jgi:hypothetical protein